MMPLLAVVLGGVVVVFAMRRGRESARVFDQSNAHSHAGALAGRLGFQLVRGNPHFNLQYPTASLTQLDGDVAVQLCGELHGVSMEMAYRRTAKDVTRLGDVLLNQSRTCITYDARVTARLNLDVGRAQIRLRQAPAYASPPDYFDGAGPSEIQTGNPTLDARLRIEADNPAVGSALAEVLASSTDLVWFHFVVTPGAVTFSMVSPGDDTTSGTGSAYAYAQIDRVLYFLAAMVCRLEGRSLPVPQAAPMPAQPHAA